MTAAETPADRQRLALVQDSALAAGWADAGVVDAVEGVEDTVRTHGHRPV
ncbi:MULTISPECIES: hypothetical protein [unclassified Streptomyces]|nr:MULTISPECIES: hypothetical protein [unclassified Streptomyces]